MNKEEIEALFDGGMDAIKEYITGIWRGLTDRISALETKFQNLPTPEKGEKGEQGIPGVNGKDGRDGKDGESIQGPPGKDGEIGPPGPQGLKGDWVKGDPGQKGDPGKDGIAGPPGPKGDRGEKGESGQSIKGDKGDQGERGLQGLAGEKGDRGENGESIIGPPGRDALQIDIFPSVNVEKSYPRGTFARYDGGLIRSYRDTIPGEAFDKSGWEVIIAGISKIEVSLSQDCREISVITARTGGDSQKRTFAIPAMIYREIYRQSEEYQKGDVVTWGGSAWHSQIDNNKSEPGKNDDWRLMVKEGRRGKDGKDGEQGKQGPPGRNGMDKL